MKYIIIGFAILFVIHGICILKAAKKQPPTQKKFTRGR